MKIFAPHDLVIIHSTTLT